MMHALYSQALESIEKAQELAEGLGNKVGILQLLFSVFRSLLSGNLRSQALKYPDLLLLINQSMPGTCFVMKSLVVGSCTDDHQCASPKHEGGVTEG